MIKPVFCIISFSMAALMVPSSAAAQFAFGGDSPVAVNAETATYKGGLTILEGNVDVLQSGTRIKSDKMDIFREEAAINDDSSLKLGAITKIVAVGNFRYTSPENSVTGNRGVYERSKGIITVTGNVTFKNSDGSTVKGDKLVYDVNKKTAKFGDNCKGDNCNSGRVNIRIE